MRGLEYEQGGIERERFRIPGTFTWDQYMELLPYGEERYGSFLRDVGHFDAQH